MVRDKRVATQFSSHREGLETSLDSQKKSKNEGKRKLRLLWSVWLRTTLLRYVRPLIMSEGYAPSMGC